MCEQTRLRCGVGRERADRGWGGGFDSPTPEAVEFRMACVNTGKEGKVAVGAWGEKGSVTSSYECTDACV